MHKEAEKQVLLPFWTLTFVLKEIRLYLSFCNLKGKFSKLFIDSKKKVTAYYEYCVCVCVCVCAHVLSHVHSLQLHEL